MTHQSTLVAPMWLCPRRGGRRLGRGGGGALPYPTGGGGEAAGFLQ